MSAIGDIDMQTRITAETEMDTRALGERIGYMLQVGDTVLLYGELGAGKTMLCQGIAKGLGIAGVITSPTFAIANEYPLKNGKLVHMDQYSITPEGFWELGLDEYWNGVNIVMVEWPREVPPGIHALSVYISCLQNGRDITVRWEESENGRWEGIFSETAGD